MFIDTKERPAGEVQQKVGRIRLSEAIRIGAKLRPQAKGDFFRNNGSCALGAAYEALGISLDSQAWSRTLHLTGAPGYIHFEITRRNDSGETRESIADWLESRGL